MTAKQNTIFMTGGTGFLGRFLVERFLDRGSRVLLLVRPGSEGKLEALRTKLETGSEQLAMVAGDIAEPGLGLSEADRQALTGKISTFFHVAALYDLKAPAEKQQRMNVEGTANALACAKDLQADCFHYVSSTAVSGMYAGRFTESMFAEAENLDNAYFQTKHDAEALVRAEEHLPWRIYRPSGIVGHSQTGEIDKVDGPYYSFAVIRKLAALPAFLTLPGVKGRGALNLVPVDFVADAIDHIAHQPLLDGRCFHLTNSRGYSPVQITNVFAEVAGAPTLSERLAINTDGALFNKLLSLEPVTAAGRSVLAKVGIPEEAIRMMQWETHYDATNTQAALVGTDIAVPSLETYADRLWAYWDTHLRTIS